jgi:hypothetical protein
MTKKTLPSLRVEAQTISRMESAISKYNQNNFVKLSTQEFRRLSYETLAQLILQDKPLPLDLE